jgi:hypothetical protein
MGLIKYAGSESHTQQVRRIKASFQAMETAAKAQDIAALL